MEIAQDSIIKKTKEAYAHGLEVLGLKDDGRPFRINFINAMSFVGQAQIKFHNGAVVSKKISYSLNFIYSNKNGNMFDNLIFHEVAHILAYYRYPNRKRKGHGAEWQDIMLKLGALDISARIDSRIYGFPISIGKNQNVWTCHCGRSYVLRDKHMSQLKSPSPFGGLYCKKCHREVNLSEVRVA